MTTAIVTALLSAIAAFVGSWLAARFALDRFRHEKIWERRAAAYTAMFEALHEQENWYTTHLRAEMVGRELKDDEKDKLSAESNAAEAALKRRLDAETWLVSDEFTKRLKRLFKDLERRSETWIDHLENGEVAIENALRDLRIIARRELGVPPDKLS
jgi:hypothetical protein